MATTIAAPQMTHDESKHWSKALSQVLRHGPGKNTTPVPRTLPIETLLQVIRVSNRFGVIDEAKIREVVATNHRFIFAWTTCPNTGWVYAAVTAV